MFARELSQVSMRISAISRECSRSLQPMLERPLRKAELPDSEQLELESVLRGLLVEMDS